MSWPPDGSLITHNSKLITNESCGLQVAFLGKHAELIVKIRKYTKRAEAHSPGFFIYIPRHEVKPKVVATAVRIVMTMLRIFPQSDLFSISYDL